MNERDSEQVASSLLERGYSLVGNEKEADIVLLNTCSVREQAEVKAIGKAGHVLSKKKKDKTKSKKKRVKAAVKNPVEAKSSPTP